MRRKMVHSEDFLQVSCENQVPRHRCHDANRLAQMEQRMPAQMRSTMTASINGNPNLSADQKAEQLKKLDEATKAAAVQAHALFADPTLVDDMIAEMVPLYAETY